MCISGPRAKTLNRSEQPVRRALETCHSIRSPSLTQKAIDLLASGLLLLDVRLWLRVLRQ